MGYQTEFNDILENRNVVPSLNSLDHLITDAKTRKEAAEASATEGNVQAPVPYVFLPLILTS